jgi:type II secretory pathway pseudopilin PulG
MLELIAILGIVALVVAMLLPIMANARMKAHRIKCDGRLGCVGLAYRIYATDHGDQFPWEVTTNKILTFGTYLDKLRGLSNELSTPIVLICPADTRKPAKNWASLSRTNLSYFGGIGASESLPQSILSGDRNITTNGARIGPGIVNLDAGEANVAWDATMHRFQGICVMGDGSVQQLSSARFKDQMKSSGQDSMTLAVP